MVKKNDYPYNIRENEIASLRDAPKGLFPVTTLRKAEIFLYGVIEIEPPRGFFGIMRIVVKIGGRGKKNLGGGVKIGKKVLSLQRILGEGRCQGEERGARVDRKWTETRPRVEAW